jgi:hypothetical protein
MTTREFIPFPLPPGRISLSPSDIPLGLYVDREPGRRISFEFVYSAGVGEPRVESKTDAARVEVGRHSHRLFKLTLELAGAPIAPDGFPGWFNSTLESVFTVLRENVALAGPRTNYELASEGLHRVPPAWMISALQDMRGGPESGHHSRR